MSITPKKIDLTNENKTEHEWASETKGTFMNMLSACRFDPIDQKYKMAPIKYSDVNLEGESIKFNDGQELTVYFSCLVEEFNNKQETKDLWWKKANEIVNSYKEQVQTEDYLKSTNTSLKKLKEAGSLKEKHELDEE